MGMYRGWGTAQQMLEQEMVDKRKKGESKPTDKKKKKSLFARCAFYLGALGAWAIPFGAVGKEDKQK